MALPQFCVQNMLRFLASHHSADDIHEMILICLDCGEKAKGRVLSKTIDHAISEHFKRRNREIGTLYSPWRNISMNQCIGDSDIPISEWMNLSDWREWD